MADLAVAHVFPLADESDAPRLEKGYHPCEAQQGQRNQDEPQFHLGLRRVVARDLAQGLLSARRTDIALPRPLAQAVAMGVDVPGVEQRTADLAQVLLLDRGVAAFIPAELGSDASVPDAAEPAEIGRLGVEGQLRRIDRLDAQDLQTGVPVLLVDVAGHEAELTVEPVEHLEDVFAEVLGVQAPLDEPAVVVQRGIHHPAPRNSSTQMKNARRDDVGFVPELLDHRLGQVPERAVQGLNGLHLAANRLPVAAVHDRFAADHRAEDRVFGTSQIHHICTHFPAPVVSKI